MTVLACDHCKKLNTETRLRTMFVKIPGTPHIEGRTRFRSFEVIDTEIRTEHPEGMLLCQSCLTKEVQTQLNIIIG